MGRWFRRIRNIMSNGRHRDDLTDEIEFHRTMLEERLQRDGLSSEDAARESRKVLGNATLAREDAREVWIPPWIQHARQDVLYAFRMMRKNPAFAVAVLFIMTLGIGTTTTVFSLVDSLILKPLPVSQPDRLVWFGSPSFSYPIFQEVQARGSHMFTSVAAWDVDDLHVDWGNGLERGQVLLASGSYYSTLGVPAAAGRIFDPGDDDGRGGRHGPVAVISYACWQRRFGGAATALGQTLRIERVPFTIIGVTPRGFFGTAPGLAPEVTIPLTTMVRLRPDRPNILRSPSSSWVHLIARLQPDLTIAQANVLLRTVWPAVLDATFPSSMPPDRRAHYLSRKTSLEPGRTGFSRVRRQFAEPLWMLLALVALLLLVACASVANLLVARTIARRRELAIRLAIGAGRGRIVRQLMTESAVWITLGAATAFLFTTWASRTLVAMMTTRQEPIVLDLEPDWRFFLFIVGLAVVAAALVALLPAWRASRAEAAPVLKQTGQISSGYSSGWTSGKLLVTAQVALTVLLLAGAALFVRSLLRVLSEEAGFERENVLVVASEPTAAGYGDSRLSAFYTDMLERLRRTPGVESAALSMYPPISDEDGAWTGNIEVDGTSVATTPKHEVYFNVVSHGYFTTLGMRVLQGRDFDATDVATSERVVVVNVSLARRFFPSGTPVGRRISIGRDPSRQDLTIVGIVQDAKYQTLQEPSLSIAYLPEVQSRERLSGDNLFTVVRISTGWQSMTETIRRELMSIDAGVPVHVERVTERIRDSLVRERALAAVASALGLTALLLACAAVYGLMSYSVSNRTSEMGVRLAFGARRATVLWMIWRDSLTLALIGIAAGLASSLFFGKFARHLLYQITPADPGSLVAAASATLIVAVCAGFIPARRAANVDPVVALRE